MSRNRVFITKKNVSAFPSAKSFNLSWTHFSMATLMIHFAMPPMGSDTAVTPLVVFRAKQSAYVAFPDTKTKKILFRLPILVTISKLLSLANFLELDSLVRKPSCPRKWRWSLVYLQYMWVVWKCYSTTLRLQDVLYRVFHLKYIFVVTWVGNSRQGSVTSRFLHKSFDFSVLISKASKI